MAIEYRLTLAGEVPPDEVAVRVVADPADRPTLTPFGKALSVNLDEQNGFTLDVLAGRNGYYEAQTDTGVWEWQPDAYVDITFRMVKDPDRYDDALREILRSVARVLASGGGDAAFVLNGDRLLLTRVNGVLQKHRRAEWWDHYGYPNEIIPDWRS